MTHVFVYGTLMFSELIKALTGKEFTTKDAVLYNYKRYLVITDKENYYPGIIRRNNCFVKGKVLLHVDEDSLKILDFFEEGDYERINERLRVDGELTQVAVYVYKKDNLKGDWNPYTFEKEKMEFYLKEVIPELIQAYKKIN